MVYSSAKAFRDRPLLLDLGYFIFVVALLVGPRRGYDDLRRFDSREREYDSP
jgi:hypothetical protein